MAEYNRDFKRKRVFALGYGAKDNPHSKVVKIEARSSLEAGLLLLEKGYVAFPQQAHFLVDSADKAEYKRVVTGRSSSAP